jgi:predicted Zn finger-like uncharacterized protein
LTKIMLLPAGPTESGDSLDRVACPLCHTQLSIGLRAFAAGGVVRCSRCQQQWDSARLGAVARYAQRHAEDAVPARRP